MSMQAIGVNFHGIHLNLESDHLPILAYASEHLNHKTVETHAHPDITVRCLWFEGAWDEDRNPFRSGENFDRIGRRMQAKQDELLWLNTVRRSGLQLRFIREDSGYTFEVSYTYHSREEKIRTMQRYEYRKYFSLMPYLIYFPAIWLLERKRCWGLIHASALAFEKGSVLVAGLGATGKTTTCVGLLQKGFDLISENLVLTDGEFLYPCYEPIRLLEDSLKMLGGKVPFLTPMSFPEGLKEKSLFHFNISERASRTRPYAVFLPLFSDRSYVKMLSPDIASEKIMAMNRLSLEIDDYNWYSSALDMQWPAVGLAMKRMDTIRAFASRLRWYELGIDRKAGVSRAISNILETIQ